MKNIKVLFALLLVLMYTACSDSILDEIDTDPNNPVDVPVKTLLAQTTTGVPFNVAGTDLAWYTSIFVEQTAGVHGQMESAELRVNGVNANAYDNAWLFIYPRILKDLRVIQKKADAEGNKNAQGIAQVLECYTFSILTDLFGDIPYSEAMLGDEGTDKPKYDKQVDVYSGILRVLDDAVSNLKMNKGVVGSEDLIFSGNTAQWVKTAYALKARVMNRVIGKGVKKADGSDITDNDILDAIALSFSSSGDNFAFDNYQDAQGWRNPLYQEEIERAHHSISRTFYDLLSEKSDPRLLVAIDDSNVDTDDENHDPEDLKGKVSGSTGNDQGKSIFPIIHPDLLTAVTEMPMLTYSELKFIEAETRERMSAGTGEVAWRDGIKASLAWFGVSDDSYASSAEYGTSEEDRIKNIIEEKYVALWPFGSIEAYSEYRRTGFPELDNPLNNEKFPVRLHYVQNELVTNAENVPKVDIYKDKLIWAK